LRARIREVHSTRKVVAVRWFRRRLKKGFRDSRGRIFAQGRAEIIGSDPKEQGEVT
jgi:hypothetical protein